MTEIESLIQRTCTGDLAAYGKLVELTQQMVFAVCHRVLANHAEALDATQETYLRAFEHRDELRDPVAMPGWLRRIAITTARNLARKRRFAFLQEIDIPDIPILDEIETTWSDSQRHSLACAVVKLTPDDRRVCDRFYHGGWDVPRLAADARVSEPAMRKRLQRIRDQLREDAEMNERQTASGISPPTGLSATVVELLSRPNLLHLPENPVGKMMEQLQVRYADYRLIEVPEMVEAVEAQKVLGPGPDYLPQEYVHAVDAARFLRYDITLPLLIAARNIGAPARLATSGRVYRNQTPSPTRDQAFHQFEVLILDEKQAMDPWRFMGETLHVVADLLPGRNTMIETVGFASCKRAWEIDVEVDGKWVSVLSWGIYTDTVLRYLGADPDKHEAFGLGYGLERMAALRFGYDDIRKLASARL